VSSRTWVEGSNQVFIDKAKALGFIGVGFSKPGTPLHFDFYRRWLKEINVGSMSYLRKHIDIRGDPTKLLGGLNTIISLAYPYPADKPTTSDGYTASRYSTPQQEDYHLRLRRLARQLCSVISEMFPESRSRVCVDSAPILERSFAESSGIGFIGKNNMLIIPGYGSYCFLAEVLTTAQFPIPSSERPENGCGTCRRCVDSCPTGALKAPFYIDVIRCLSYLTIESKDDLDREVAEKMGHTFYGCDVCQEVCPFNKGEPNIISLPSTKDILAMNEIEFKRIFGRTALERAGLIKLKANIRILVA
jgi:epoxyqueuosine reductase